MNDTLDRCVTAEEAGRLLGLKTSTIRRLTYEKRLPCVRVTGRRAVRYRVSDLQALVRMRAEPMRSEGRR